MNIAFVVRTHIWGGVKTWMLEFGRELKKNGHQVAFFSNDERFTEEARSFGAEAYRRRFGADYSPSAIRYFYRRFRDLKIDITCMNLQKELRTAGIAARMLKIPVVQRVGLPSDINHKLDQRLAQRHIVDAIVVTAHWMKAETVRLNPFVPADKITVIPNGRAVLAPPKSGKNRPLRLVISSRLSADKGHADLLDALAMLKDTGYGGFHCDIYGEGDLKPALQNRIHRLNLDERVVLKGFCRDLTEKLGRYHVGVLTSRSEGLANTACEYLAAGLPVVVTRVGGMPELVRHDQNGYLYRYSDIDALAGHLRDIMKMSDDRYAALSRQAWLTVLHRFNLQKNTARLESFFDTCLAAGFNDTKSAPETYAEQSL